MTRVQQHEWNMLCNTVTSVTLNQCTKGNSDSREAWVRLTALRVHFSNIYLLANVQCDYSVMVLDYSILQLQYFLILRGDSDLFCF